MGVSTNTTFEIFDGYGDDVSDILLLDVFPTLLRHANSMLNILFNPLCYLCPRPQIMFKHRLCCRLRWCGGDESNSGLILSCLGDFVMEPYYLAVQ